MRKGRRKVFASLGILLFGSVVLAAPPERAAPTSATVVRMTVEINWAVSEALEIPEGDEFPLDFDVNGGRVLEAVAWPSTSGNPPERRIEGGWRLGEGRSGRARARIEAPLGSSLSFLAGGQTISIPVALLLDGPQRTPPQTPVALEVQRVPWDTISVGLADGDGTVVPGGTIPLLVGFDVVTPEAADLVLRCQGELRPAHGGDAVWRDELRETLTSNQSEQPRRVWEIPAPLAEGTYTLELRANWEPAPSGRLGRLIRAVKLRPAAATGSALRRVSVTIVRPKSAPEPASTSVRPGRDVDQVDLGRIRGQRMFAFGRSPRAQGQTAWPVPDSAVSEPKSPGLLRGLIARPEGATLGQADSATLAWSAVGMKVAHPDRPHRLTVTVAGGQPAALGVAMVNPGGQYMRPRIVLDACASGPPILENGPPAIFSWLVWPGTAEPLLLFVNRSNEAPVRIGSAVLTELSEVPAGPTLIEPDGERRTLALVLAGNHALDRFGGGEPGPYDSLARARNLAQYAAHCGVSAVVLPYSLADRVRRQALDGRAAEDPIGPDQLGLLLRILERQGLSAWLEIGFQGTLPGLPAPGSPDALSRGLVRVDARGRSDGVYHPLNPEVRQAFGRRLAEVVGPWKELSCLSGVLVRLGPGPTLLGGPETGLDDLTFQQFVSETFDDETERTVPGLGKDDPERFAARKRFLAGAGRAPWLTWRSRGIAALYGELAQTARRTREGLVLAVATPGVEEGPAGQEARRVDLQGLAPAHAWRAVGLDLETWPSAEDAPIVLRGVGLSTDDLAHDLATNPDLDAKVAVKARRGLHVRVDDEPPSEPRKPGSSGLWLTAATPADEVAAEEPLGHALAALDARWLLLSTAAVLGREERVRRFASVFRALPSTPADAAPAERQPFGVAVRTVPGGPNTYVSLANDSPYPVRVETVLAAEGAATFDDLGRGLRLAPRSAGGESHLVLDLLPFGVAAIRVGSPQVRLGRVTPYPSDAVVASMQAQYTEMVSQLARLNRRPSGGPAGPPNSGFEPETTRPVTLKLPNTPTLPHGWQLVGGRGSAAAVDLAQFHSGQGSVRLDAPAPPAAILSEKFVPNVHSELTIQVWLRSDKPDTRIRLWIEGESAGQPFVRRSDLTVQPDWAVHAVRASALPPGGLDAARIRFELLSSGTLWVDDLAVSGATLTDPERLNARRALVAAMHAYDERKYAEFARLAGSHWARHPGLATENLPATASRPVDPHAATRTREASALPSDHRLR